MKVEKVSKSGVPVINVGKYVIASGSALEVKEGVYMPVVMTTTAPHFLGLIFHTTNPERWNNFKSNKQGVSAANYKYMVGLDVVGSIEEYEITAACEDAKSLATMAREMLDFYMDEVFYNKKPGYIAKYKIRE